MSKYLIVVDMQNDFIDGALGTKYAEAIVPAVKARIEKGISEGERVIFTRDCHGTDYMKTREGRKLPVPHCVVGTHGFEISPELKELADSCEIIDKPTFGSIELAKKLAESDRSEKIEKITLIGLCTDICVISNCMVLKAALPEADIAVVSDCCAGVTPESHFTALDAMKACQVEIE